MEWSRPSRNDHYIMRLILEVMRSNERLKLPPSFSTNDLRIEFEEKARTGSPMNSSLTPEQRIAYSQAAWFGSLRINPKKGTKSPFPEDPSSVKRQE